MHPCQDATSCDSNADCKQRKSAFNASLSVDTDLRPKQLSTRQLCHSWRLLVPEADKGILLFDGVLERDVASGDIMP